MKTQILHKLLLLNCLQDNNEFANLVSQEDPNVLQNPQLSTSKPTMPLSEFHKIGQILL